MLKQLLNKKYLVVQYMFKDNYNEYYDTIIEEYNSSSDTEKYQIINEVFEIGMKISKDNFMECSRYLTLLARMKRETDLIYSKNFRTSKHWKGIVDKYITNLIISDIHRNPDRSYTLSEINSLQERAKLNCY